MTQQCKMDKRDHFKYQNLGQMKKRAQAKAFLQDTANDTAVQSWPAAGMFYLGIIGLTGVCPTFNLWGQGFGKCELYNMR